MECGWKLKSFEEFLETLSCIFLSFENFFFSKVFNFNILTRVMMLFFSREVESMIECINKGV